MRTVSVMKNRNGSLCIFGGKNYQYNVNIEYVYFRNHRTHHIVIMRPMRILLIIITMIIFTIVLWNLLKQRDHIKQMPSNEHEAAKYDHGHKEGFAATAVPTGYKPELKKMMITNPGSGISNYNLHKMGDFPLSEYVIKASYNSAFSGSFVGAETIAYILSRGVRFLDFSVFDVNGTPMIGVSNDGGITKISKNDLSLDDAVKAILTYGFSGPSPNFNDPLFVQIRIYSTDNNIYQSVAISLSALQGRLFAGKVTPNTMMSNLMNKIVLVVDKGISGIGYANYPVCPVGSNARCVNLGSLVNMESSVLGGASIYIYKTVDMLQQLTNPVHILNNCTTDVNVLRMIDPAPSDLTNPKYGNFIHNYGAQYIMNRFYVTDMNLRLYEKFFADNKTAFVPFCHALPYWYGNQGSHMPS